MRVDVEHIGVRKEQFLSAKIPTAVVQSALNVLSFF